MTRLSSADRPSRGVSQFDCRAVALVGVSGHAGGDDLVELWVPDRTPTF
jgi:hypothetical protein